MLVIDLSAMLRTVAVRYRRPSSTDEQRLQYHNQLSEPSLVDRVERTRTRIRALLPKESLEKFDILWMRRDEMRALLEMDARADSEDDPVKRTRLFGVPAGQTILSERDATTEYFQEFVLLNKAAA